jgi:hypothetical protein
MKAHTMCSLPSKDSVMANFPADIEQEHSWYFSIAHGSFHPCLILDTKLTHAQSALYQEVLMPVTIDDPSGFHQ